MKVTKIQWCDSTVNPVSGCSGCELWHENNHSCYAGNLHQRFPNNRGFAPKFETPKTFEGRMSEAARWPDLKGTARVAKPWLDSMPRCIFVSDMGDALSEGTVILEHGVQSKGGVPFEFLKSEIIDAVLSENGQRHIWQWLTKRPRRMREFADWLHRDHVIDFPPNLWIGTSITTKRSLSRAKQLVKVGGKEVMRFLSVEPLWEAVDLTPYLAEIGWVIVGGESSQGSEAKKFHCDWARQLRDQCAEAGVPYFVKQLGSNVWDRGSRLKLPDRHGGDWRGWPKDLRVRQMPLVRNQENQA